DGDCLHPPEENRRNVILRTVNRYALTFFQLLVVILAASAFLLLLVDWRHTKHCTEEQGGNCTQDAWAFML
ncbi:hypothetical protein MTO96_046963, partial [Rhipicephalus appendiculatus]